MQAVCTARYVGCWIISAQTRTAACVPSCMLAVALWPCFKPLVCRQQQFQGTPGQMRMWFSSLGLSSSRMVCKALLQRTSRPRKRLERRGMLCAASCLSDPLSEEPAAASSGTSFGMLSCHV